MKAKLSLLAAALLFGAMNIGVASASVVLVTKLYENENDCAGLFGQGFDNCTVNGSPIVVKYDQTNGGYNVQVNTAFPTITGVEFTFSNVAPDGSTGTWTYTKNDTGDPDIKYWVAKGGNDFLLHWYVPATYTCDLTNDLQGCLNKAQVTTTGIWFTPTNPNNGKRYGLSHLSFYDTSSNGKPPEEAPAPGVLGLLGLGLLGLAWARRRV